MFLGTYSNSKWTLLRVSLLLTLRQEYNSSSLAVLTYFSEDSSVEKPRAIKGAMPVTTNSSHQPLIWSVWKFLCHTSYSMALFPSFWLFPLMNCIQFITAFLPYFSVESGFFVPFFAILPTLWHFSQLFGYFFLLILVHQRSHLIFLQILALKKTRAMKGAMPVTTNSSHQPLNRT